MPRSELVATRADDLSPGQRVRLPRGRRLETVVSTYPTDGGRFVVHTDGTAYACRNYTLIDAEDCGEVRL